MDNLTQLSIRVTGYSTTEIALYGLEGLSEPEITRFMCQRDHRRIFNRAGLMPPAPMR
jgi:hypothetical protein